MAGERQTGPDAETRAFGFTREQFAVVARWMARAEAAEAERDAYKRALEEIERVCGWSERDGEMAVQIAREVLAGESSTTEE